MRTPSRRLTRQPATQQAIGLTRIYIEALLVDEELADQVWKALDKGEIDDFTAYFAWTLISLNNSDQSMEVRR